MEPEQKNENEKSAEETPKELKVDEKLVKRIIGVLTATAFVTAVAYLYAYWSRFGVNVFEFIDISNIIAHSIMPLILGVGVILSLLFFFCIPLIVSIIPIPPDTEKGLKHLAKLLISGLCFVLVSIFLIWTSTSLVANNRIVCGGILGTIILFLITLSKTKEPKIFLFIIIISFPILGTVYGLVEAESIKRGDKYRYVGGTSISEEVRKRGDDKIRYIGTMGDYFFFLIPSDKSIYIAAKEEIKPFVLKRYDRQKNKE